MPVPDFASTPLGQCMAQVASTVWTSAYRGNYIYFGLRNHEATDPLAGKPQQIDQRGAVAALAEYDDEVLDCARRHTPSAPVGETVQFNVDFWGATGKVHSIAVFYVEDGSPFRRCAEQAYSQAEVPQFRTLKQTVTHRLSLVNL